MKNQKNSSIKILSINIDGKIKFNKHVSITYSKSIIQTNTLTQLQKCMGEIGKANHKKQLHLPKLK